MDNENSNYNPQVLIIGNKAIYFQQSIKLLYHLNFNAHTSTSSQKTSNQINALCRLNFFLKQDDKKFKNHPYDMGF